MEEQWAAVIGVECMERALYRSLMRARRTPPRVQADAKRGAQRVIISSCWNGGSISLCRVTARSQTELKMLMTIYLIQVMMTCQLVSSAMAADAHDLGYIILFNLNWFFSKTNYVHATFLDYCMLTCNILEFYCIGCTSNLENPLVYYGFAGSI